MRAQSDRTEAFMDQDRNDRKRAGMGFDRLCPCGKRVPHHGEDGASFRVEGLLGPCTEGASYDLEVLDRMGCDARGGEPPAR